jgi:hypothetical protein
VLPIPTAEQLSVVPPANIECLLHGHAMISVAWGQDYCENEGCGLVVGERDPSWEPTPPPAELDDFLGDIDLPPSQKTKVKESLPADRNGTFNEFYYWARLSKAKIAATELNNYAISHGLFLPPSIKIQFAEIVEVIRSVCYELEYRRDERRRSADDPDAWDIIRKNAKPKLEAIEKAIANRLLSHSPAVEKQHKKEVG